MFKPDQFAALLGKRLAEDMIARRLDAQGVMTGLQILPLVHGRKLLFQHLNFKPETDVFIDQSDIDLARCIGLHIVLPHLLVEVQFRLGERAIANALLLILIGMRRPNHIADRRHIARAFSENRVTDVDMIAIHVRRAVESMIDHTIM